MYEAYSVEEVACNPHIDSSSIVADVKHDQLLIARRDGALVSCQYSSSAGSGSKYGSSAGGGKWIPRVWTGFERRAVSEMRLVDSHNLIVCLAESQITVHDAREPYKLLHSMPKYRPTSAFGLHLQAEGNLLRLALSSRKRVHLFKWMRDEFIEDGESPAIYLSDNPSRLLWAGRHALVVGMRTEYLFVQVFADEEVPYEIEDLGKLRHLLTTGSRPADYPSIIVDLPDRCHIGLCQDTSVHFFDYAGHPSKIFQPPCTFSDSPVDVAYDPPYLAAALPNSLIEIRSILPFSRAPVLIQRLSLERVAQLTPAKPGILYAANERFAWQLSSRSALAENIRLLGDERHYELAIELAERNPHSVEAAFLLELRRRHALDLFVQKRFPECFNTHLAMKTDVLLVTNLFPLMIPEKYLATLNNYPAQLLELFDPAINLNDAERKSAILALGDFLSARRTEVAQVMSRHFRQLKDTGKKLLNTTEFKQYEETLRLVDSVLLKCYLETKSMLVPSLLRLADNSCIVSEAEQDLSSRQKWSELLILFERNKLHRKALNLLKREWKIPAGAGATPAFNAEHMADYLQNLCFTGPSQSENLKLLYEFAPLVLEADVDLGVAVFTAERNAKEQPRNLDRDETLSYLKSTHPPAVIPYLEHLIAKGDEHRCKFHEELAEHYIERIRSLMKDYTHTLNDDEVRNRGGEEDGELGSLRKRLMAFLEASREYDPEKVLALLDDYLLEEKAIIYGRLKRHEEALAIYSTVLMDFQAADRHCSHYYQPHGDDKLARNLFFLLFTVYASPAEFVASLQAPNKVVAKHGRVPAPNIPEALKVLRRHSMEIDTVKALSMIPTVTPLQRVWEGLQPVFESIKNKATTTSLTLAVTRLALRSLKERLRQLRQQRVKIDYSVECVLCKKKISESAFVLYPSTPSPLSKEGARELVVLKRNSDDPERRIAHLFCYNKSASGGESSKSS